MHLQWTNIEISNHIITSNEIDGIYCIIHFLNAWADLLLLITTCQFDWDHSHQQGHMPTSREFFATSNYVPDKNFRRLVEISSHGN